MVRTGLKPGMIVRSPGFICIDGACLLESQSYVVEAIEQAMLLERVDTSNPITPPSGRMDFLRLKIDGDRGVGAATGVIHQLVEVFLADDDRQNAVLEAVVVEDVGEAGRDHAADAEIEERPGACSRDEPQPKLSPATRIEALRQAGLLSTKSGFSVPSSL
jgi:hypothetical protein